MKNLVIVAAALALVACSSSPKPAPAEPGETTPQESTAPEPATADQSAAPDIGEGVAWADKSHEQKAAFMKAKVVPAVAAIWKESPSPGDKVDCTLCHGQGAKEGKFDMPNPGLPVLDPKNKFEAHQDQPEWLQFMGKKLMPTMVETLGVAPYDPATHEGFGCFACHTMASD